MPTTFSDVSTAYTTTATKATDAATLLTAEAAKIQITIDTLNNKAAELQQKISETTNQSTSDTLSMTLNGMRNSIAEMQAMHDARVASAAAWTQCSTLFTLLSTYNPSTGSQGSQGV